MDDLPLFSGVEPPDETTWSVARLNEAIQSALQERFPREVWVRGEIQGLARTRMRKHWYFELVEKEARGDGVKARLSVALLSWKRAEVDRIVEATAGFELEDGIEVRVRGRIDFYPPFGKLQLSMSAVDPSFTLGQLAVQRERVLQALQREGLLRRNARLPMPLVPERIGLVTSVGSAAYNDFVQELRQGGLYHHVEVVDARVQGAEAESTLLAALATLARRRPDVVAIIRGGGSRSDLAAFDGEALARTIARMPVPVVTGIGHEIDTSVADMVAHTAYKTPTACAAALVRRSREYLEAVDGLWDRLSQAALDRVGREGEELSSVAHRTVESANAHLGWATGRLDEARRRVLREAPRMLQHRQRRLLGLAGELRATGRLSVLRRWQALQMAMRILSASRLRALLQRRRIELEGKRRRVGRSSLKELESQGNRLDGVGARVRALDPMRVLARGYSISRDEKGRLVRSVLDVKASQRWITTLVDGEVLSRVEECRKREAKADETGWVSMGETAVADEEKS